MNWIDFLNDPELNSDSAQHEPPSGAYLCKKVAHDILECLNTYVECAKLSSALQDDLPADNYLWFTNWESPVERWISEIDSLWKHSEQLPDESLVCPNLIAQMGEIVAQARLMQIESQALVMPTNNSAMKIMRIAKRAIDKLNLLRYDIQAQNYKRLWITLNYGDLVEGS